MFRKFTSIGIFALLIACSSEDATSEFPIPAKLGGDTSVVEPGDRAYIVPVKNLLSEHRGDFFAGNSFFTQSWVIAPASTTGRDGLGPLYNAKACAECHISDGRSGPGDGTLPLFGVVIRMSLESPDGLEEDPNYGGQFQPFGIPGIPGEGEVWADYTEQQFTIPGPTTVSLRTPTYRFENLAYGPLADRVLLSPRTGPAMIGLGLIEAIDENDIIDGADPDDLDKNGVSGRVNYVTGSTGKKQVGRFGWKANKVSLASQAQAAFLVDIGITSNAHPDNNCTMVQLDCDTASTLSPSPEISDEILGMVVNYISLLAVPEMRDREDPTVQRGYQLFEEIGCTDCHRPHWKTGEHPSLAELSNQDIYPFSDFLIHDMGEALADHRPDESASGSEWRTPPLWGHGLQKVVNGHEYFLHDGRARGFVEAIVFHGGEAEEKKNRFISLPKEEREALIRFLESI